MIRTIPLRALAMVSCVVLAVNVSPGTVPGQRSGDVLIVELPTALRVYDIYQQQLPPAVQRSIPPFVPMVIDAERTTLSDGFTPCMKVIIGGSVFFLLRERDGDVVGLAGAGYSRLFRKVEILSDSVRILRGQNTRISTPDRSTTRPLRNGETLRRCFRDRNMTYVEAAPPSQSFGWVPLNVNDEGHSWEVIRHDDDVTTLSAAMISSVRLRVDRANGILRSLFSVFNAETSAHRVPPQWSVETVTDGMRCTASDSSLAVLFPRSVHQLAKEIEATLIGTSYMVRETDGMISVTRAERNAGGGR